jgi:hypothetical protein
MPNANINDWNILEVHITVQQLVLSNMAYKKT